MKQTETYVHHNKLVHVMSDVKGTHREICLCYQCAKYKPGRHSFNCRIAASVFKNCNAFNIVTPIVECPAYVAQASVEEPAVAAEEVNEGFDPEVLEEPNDEFEPDVVEEQQASPEDIDEMIKDANSGEPQ